jgi:hypothetical protein
MKKNKGIKDLLNDPFFRNIIQPLIDNPQEDGHLFSKEFIDHMEPYKDRNICDAMDEDYMRHLCSYGGMSDEKFDEILSTARE